MAETISDQTARTMRRLWFDYLGAVEPVRPKLHAYCLRLTGSVFDAEDLVQDSLLRAFGALGRGDLHGEASRMRDARAYLCRTATNLWIDAQRRRARAASGAADATDIETPREPAMITPAAGAALFERTAPQERAAVVLKDVFDFSLEEIAELLSTTPGAVKAALHRGRGRLAGEAGGRSPARGAPASTELIDRFIAAFSARDIEAAKALLLESVVYEPLGVGGERGREAIWIAVGLADPADLVCEPHIVEGEKVLVYVSPIDGPRQVVGVSRLEEADGRVSRHISYYFCPDTLALVARQLGITAASHGYHQDPDTLERMIASTTLPWRGLTRR